MLHDSLQDHHITENIESVNFLTIQISMTDDFLISENSICMKNIINDDYYFLLDLQYNYNSLDMNMNLQDKSQDYDNSELMINDQNITQQDFCSQFQENAVLRIYYIKNNEN